MIVYVVIEYVKEDGLAVLYASTDRAQALVELNAKFGKGRRSMETWSDGEKIATDWRSPKTP